MKLLRRRASARVNVHGDFCFAVEGEPVLLGCVCATDQADPDGGCGCGRAFSAMSSMRATTTALVRELDISYDDLTGAVGTHLVAAGMGPDALGPVDFADLLDETVHFARFWPAGTVVGRRLDHVRVRSFPAGHVPRPFSFRDL